MANSTRKSLYDIALDGQGFVLVGDPTAPRRTCRQQPVFGNRFAQGDRNFQDFSLWWYWAQRDFSAGLKQLNIWEDDRKFYSGNDVDVFSTPGRVKTLGLPTSVNAFGTSSYDRITAAAYGIVNGSTMALVALRGKNGTTQSAIFTSTNGSTFGSDVTAAAVPDDGNGYTMIRRLNIDGKFWISRADDNWTFSTYDGTTHVDLTATVGGSATSGLGVMEAGGRAWAFFIDNTSPGLKLKVRSSTDLTTWTERISLIGATFQGAVELNGNLLYLVTYPSNFAELRLYDISADTDVLVHRFIGYTVTLSAGSRGGGLATLDGQSAYFAFDNGEIWKYDGTTALLVYQDVSNRLGSILGFGFIEHGQNLYLPGLAISGDGKIYPGYLLPINATGSDDANRTMPLLSVKLSGDSAATLWSVTSTNSTTLTTLYKQSGGSFNWSLVTNDSDGNLPGIDKLYNSVRIYFDTLSASVGGFDVYYRLNGSSSQTLIGSVGFGADGAVSSKEFFFGTNVTGKSLTLIIIPAASTSVFRGFFVKFLPIPHPKFQWSVSVHCADELQLKDGSTYETKSGEWLRNYLRNSWIKRQILTFEDFDGETLTLDGALDSAATTIPVDEKTDNLPEIGWVKINNEIIQYGGKNRNQLLSCTRAARGTVAASHTDGDAVSTSYNVVITDYAEEVPVYNHPHKREYRVTLTLLEA